MLQAVTNDFLSVCYSLAKGLMTDGDQYTKLEALVFC